MSASPGTSSERGLLATLVDDVRSLVRAAPASVPHRAFSRTVEGLDEFYLSEERRKRLAAAGVFKRWLLRSWWLFKALILKLTPARRLLLVIGLLNASATRVELGENITINLPAIGLAMILLVLMLELKDKLVARDELEEGRLVQRALVPATAPELDGWDAWFYSQSANEVSGDLVDALALDDDRAALVLADVSGKGLSAALLSAKLQATVRALIGDSPTLGALGDRVNRTMYRDGVRGRFATMVCLLPGGDGTVRLLNAGHMAPLVLRPLAIDELARGCVALGMVPNTPYAEQATCLAAGDTLVVYSDGVTEAMNAQREFFGDDRLRSVLHRMRGRTSAEVGQAVVDAVAAFVGDAPVHDDVSLIVLRRLG